MSDPEKSVVATEKVEAEKSPELLYLDALEKKRDTLLAFHALTSFREGRKVQDMTPENIGYYNILKQDWQSKKETSFAAWDILPEQDQEDLAAHGSRLLDVQIELTTLKAQLKGVPPEAERPAEPAAEKPEEIKLEEAPSVEKPAVQEKPEAEPGTEETVAMPGPVTVEKPPREMTLDEIEERITHAKRTGRVPGVSPEGLAYWETQKEEFLERQKAEEKAKRAEELKRKIKELEEQLIQKQKYLDSEVAQKIQFAKDTGRVPGIGPEGLAYWESEKEKTEQEIKDLEKEKKKLEKELKSFEGGLGKSFKNAVKNVYEKTKSAVGSAIEGLKNKFRIARESPQAPGEAKKEVAPSKWGWFKERAKGFATLGIWEVFRAEQFRQSTKLTANNIEAYASQIAKDKNLNLEEAEEYAWKTYIEAGGKPGEKGEVSTGDAFAGVIERKYRENQEYKERIVNNAIENLKENLGTERKKIGTYKGEAGQDVLTQDNINKIKEELAAELEKVSFGTAVKDLKDFRKLLRGNLDEKWWRRYIWGPAEAALWGAGYAYMTMPGSEQVVTAAAGKTGTAATEAAVKAYEVTLNQNVWHTLDTMSKVPLSDPQLIDLSQQVLDANGMYEQEWIKGSVGTLLSSRQLPVGMSIRIPLEVMRIMGYLI